MNLIIFRASPGAHPTNETPPLLSALLAKSQEHRGGRWLIRVLRDHQRPRHSLGKVTRIQKKNAGTIFQLKETLLKNRAYVSFGDGHGQSTVVFLTSTIYSSSTIFTIKLLSSCAICSHAISETNIEEC